MKYSIRTQLVWPPPVPQYEYKKLVSSEDTWKYAIEEPGTPYIQVERYAAVADAKLAVPILGPFVESYPYFEDDIANGKDIANL